MEHKMVPAFFAELFILPLIKLDCTHTQCLVCKLIDDIDDRGPMDEAEKDDNDDPASPRICKHVVVTLL
jgi:hypothetical protein